MEAAHAIRASKKALRKSITETLRALSHDAVDLQSQRAATILLSMREYDRANRLSVYLSMEGAELQTNQIVVDALQRGKKVFVPHIRKSTEETAGPKDTVMDMLALHSVEEFRNLQRDSWGIPVLPKDGLDVRENCFGGKGMEGVGDAQSSTGNETGIGLDLIVVPGMAFDSKFGRLGHGKGYYDKFFSRYRRSLAPGSNSQAEMPKLVALALSEQVLPDSEEVPTTSTDWQVDAIVLGSGELRCRQ